MDLTIKAKLRASFGLILSVFFITSMINYSMISDSEDVQERITDLRVKTVTLGKDIETGIQGSLAGLRGYMILGADPAKAQAMKKAREQAWTTINNAINQFDVLSRNWTDANNITLLRQLKGTLQEFSEAQQQVEDISHTNENIPSYNLLLNEAAPNAAIMLDALNKIIDEEEKLAATSERKQLLKYLADTRGSFAVGLANIRAYLLSGDSKFSQNFKAKWQINQQRLAQVNERSNLFTTSQFNNWQTYVSTRQKFAPLPNEMFQLRASGQWNQANYWLGTKAAPKAAEALNILRQMRESQDKLLSNDIQHLQDSNSAIKTTLITAIIICLGIGIAAAVFISNDITSRLSPIVHRAEDIAKNDMSGIVLDVKGNDELSKLTLSINQMSTGLKNLVSETAGSMSDVANGASDIQQANRAMFDSINQVSTQVEQISAAIEELTASSKDVTNNCIEASENAKEASSLAHAGGQLAEKTTDQMEQIKKTFEDSSAGVSLLNVKSQEIESIVNVIKGIADQTNLLALNAAIEAARAGEQGRGFAVVADEVRQLARRTTDATGEVESAIAGIHSETGKVVQMMESGNEKLIEGFAITNQTQDALQDIINSAEQVANRIQTIANTAEQQSSVTDEVAKNSNKIHDATQNLEDESANVLELANVVNRNSTEKAKELHTMVHSS